ncbi:hypothetical protein P280DRAFT_155041 [Massarina eburnea CBS 473.64]|uniref:Uncharacterized protein n=1 Tax=Massarina eburnea CBS 473.64 TaxID=1395130 RepID=A0A6A6RLR6_9PLEO|nr:hypothetical protein P280DRAFT_155041 [Massarina eburnea CBS 473.64]
MRPPGKEHVAVPAFLAERSCPGPASAPQDPRTHHPVFVHSISSPQARRHTAASRPGLHVDAECAATASTSTAAQISSRRQLSMSGSALTRKCEAGECVHSTGSLDGVPADWAVCRHANASVFFFSTSGVHVIHGRLHKKQALESVSPTWLAACRQRPPFGTSLTTCMFFLQS